MGSHSVTCHPTQVNTRRLNFSQSGLSEGWKAELYCTGWANYTSSGCKFSICLVYICQKLWKLARSRQSYCKNKQACFLAHPVRRRRQCSVLYTPIVCVKILLSRLSSRTRPRSRLHSTWHLSRTRRRRMSLRTAELRNWWTWLLRGLLRDFF